MATNYSAEPMTFTEYYRKLIKGEIPKSTFMIITVSKNVADQQPQTQQIETDQSNATFTYDIDDIDDFI